MKITSEKSLSRFEFWGQASYNAKKLTTEQLDELESILENDYPDGIDETHLNDIMAYDFETVCEWLNLKSEVRIKVSKIEWDFDDDDENPDLPTQFEFEIELPFEYEETDMYDAIENYIDSEFGFCYKSINYEIEEL